MSTSLSRIVGFHQDAVGDWVAELDCGHGQHMRHDPPWQVRPWVISAAGRAARLGQTVNCRYCDGVLSAPDADAAARGLCRDGVDEVAG